LKRKNIRDGDEKMVKTIRVVKIVKPVKKVEKVEAVKIIEQKEAKKLSQDIGFLILLGVSIIVCN